MTRDELVHGVPYAAFINASFAYWKPLQPNRFNATRGAWYAALAVETCMAEVAHHMAEFLAQSGEWKGVVDYAEMFASMAGEFVDMRMEPKHLCLDPDPAIGYPAGNAIADAARARGLNGVIYPSVRHAGGTCIVALRPNAVQSVAPGALYRFEWSGVAGPCHYAAVRIGASRKRAWRHCMQSGPHRSIESLRVELRVDSDDPVGARQGTLRIDAGDPVVLKDGFERGFEALARAVSRKHVADPDLGPASARQRRRRSSAVAKHEPRRPNPA